MSTIENDSSNCIINNMIDQCRKNKQEKLMFSSDLELTKKKKERKKEKKVKTK